MKVDELVNAVATKSDLVSFVEALAEELRNDSSLWKNTSLELFLEALAAWIQDSDGYYENHGMAVPESPSWKNVAEMLLAATMYD